ncbi:hypothetical protein IEO21_09743 [Rhodonia placenta]|uniref:Uncharacterized protein n=1 Tax=Rhodonia placenta TaxID=104341 RepID=A0A8H7TY69_9APHY|nr:hypothetical protein IEO21_09743 [Postia placenta]
MILQSLPLTHESISTHKPNSSVSIHTVYVVLMQLLQGAGLAPLKKYLSHLDEWSNCLDISLSMCCS